MLKLILVQQQDQLAECLHDDILFLKCSSTLLTHEKHHHREEMATCSHSFLLSSHSEQQAMCQILKSDLHYLRSLQFIQDELQKYALIILAFGELGKFKFSWIAFRPCLIKQTKRADIIIVQNIFLSTSASPNCVNQSYPPKFSRDTHFHKEKDWVLEVLYRSSPFTNSKTTFYISLILYVLLILPMPLLTRLRVPFRTGTSSDPEFIIYM